jgi:proteasome lid subunit RPN8/RPN11
MNDYPIDPLSESRRSIPASGRHRLYDDRLDYEHKDTSDDGMSCERFSDAPIPIWRMKIIQPALREMMNYLCDRDPEAAGILLGPAGDDILITHFIPDATGRSSPASFELDGPELTRVLRRMKPAGIQCKGIVHTHPAGLTSPSQGDLAYLRKLFAKPGSDQSPFFVPIVCNGRLYPYVFAQARVWHCDLVLV